MSSPIKFQVYYSTSSKGPWTLANNTPIPIDPEGNTSYTITGLNTNTRYFVAIVGGIEEEGTFYPLINQHIGPNASGASDIGGIQPVTVSARTFTPMINRSESVGNQFFIDMVTIDSKLGQEFDISGIVVDSSLGQQFNIGSIV